MNRKLAPVSLCVALVVLATGFAFANAQGNNAETPKSVPEP